MRIMSPTLLAALLTGSILLGACGGGDDSGDAGDDPAPSADNDGGDDGGSDGPSQPEVEALDAAEICEAITADAVGGALGVDVTQADASDLSTPQCSYVLDGGSNITVASMRPEDVGDRSTSEAFDFVLDVNRSVATGTDVEESEIDAGDRSVLLSGEALQLGVIASGGHILTVIVPLAVEAADAEALLVAIADAVA